MLFALKCIFSINDNANVRNVQRTTECHLRDTETHMKHKKKILDAYVKQQTEEGLLFFMSGYDFI